MSLEEARREAYELMIADDSKFKPRQDLANALLDRLIFEVRAEISCEIESETWTDCPDMSARYKEYANYKWCRTCAARSRLSL